MSAGMMGELGIIGSNKSDALLASRFKGDLGFIAACAGPTPE
jgi:hypothetical protein